MMQSVKTHSGAVIHLCACCREDVAHFHDEDLGGLVCHSCYACLRWSVAWLKSAGIRSCVRVNDDRAKGRP